MGDFVFLVGVFIQSASKKFWLIWRGVATDFLEESQRFGEMTLELLKSYKQML